MTYQIHHGDSLEILKTMPDNSIDSIVTDPPYGIRFMGAAWDGEDIEAKVSKRRSNSSHDPSATGAGAHNSISAEAGKYDLSPKGLLAFQLWTMDWATEVLRVLKPGGYLISFAAPRTYHRMVCGLEDAGFEIRDQLQWVFGSGFPKSMDIAKAMDKAANVEPQGTGQMIRSGSNPKARGGHDLVNSTGSHEEHKWKEVTVPVTDEAKQWQGFGTALKPAYEPICLARKPLIGTVVANILTHGTGAINIDGCRVGEEHPRFPTNFIHDGSDEVRKAFPDSKGQQGDLKSQIKCRQSPNGIFGGMRPALDHKARIESDQSASRFFYCAKASRQDREEGLETFLKKNAGMKNSSGRGISPDPYREILRANTHPTVKPTELMRYLVRLVTPKGGTTLDLFMGSGTTGKAAILEGFNFIGIDREVDYVEIARARCKHAYEGQQDLFGGAA